MELPLKRANCQIGSKIFFLKMYRGLEQIFKVPPNLKISIYINIYLCNMCIPKGLLKYCCPYLVFVLLIFFFS